MIAAASVGAGAFAYAVWVSRMGHALHGELRNAAVIAESARGEVAALHEKLTSTAEALTDSRRRHVAEASMLSGLLKEAREKLAATDTPEGLIEALTRRERS